MERIKQFEPFFGEWYAESFIGAGSFGQVYKIYRGEAGKRSYAALKHVQIPADENDIAQLRLNGMDSKAISGLYAERVKDIESEIRIMSQLRKRKQVFRVILHKSVILFTPTRW